MDWEDYKKSAKRVKELNEKNGFTKQQPSENIHGDCDYVWAPEKGGATVIYLFVMIFGSIFNARVLVWIVATLVYANFMSKHSK
jgi:hypothetical protein